MKSNVKKAIVFSILIIFAMGSIFFIHGQVENKGFVPKEVLPPNTTPTSPSVTITSNLNPAYRHTNVTFTAHVKNFEGLYGCGITYHFSWCLPGITHNNYYNSTSNNDTDSFIHSFNGTPTCGIDHRGVEVTVTNITGYSISADFQENVYYPVVHTHIDTKNPLDCYSESVNVGTTVTFNSSISYGIPPFTHQWYINGAPVSYQTGVNMTCLFSNPGTYNITVEYTSVTGPYTNHFYSTSALEITVYPPISSKLIISKQYIDVGQEVNFKVNATGSSQSYTGSYTLTYTNDESTLTTGEGLQFNFTFPDESPFNCYAVALNWKVVSSTGAVSWANDSEICIHIDPTISIAEQYSSRDVRIDDKFTSSGPFSSSSTIGVYGGWKPYKVTWQYENLSVGKWENITTTVGDSDSSALYNFSLAGTYEIRAHLVDNANYQVNSSEVELTVNPAMRLNASVVPSKVVNMHNSEVCSDICIELLRTGGSSIDCSTIEVNGKNAISNVESTGNPYKLKYPMPQNPGKYEYVVFADDGTGGSATGYANFTVLSSDMSVTTNVPSITVQGNSYSLSASASAPSYLSYKHDFNLVGYSYEWHIGKTNISGKSTVFDFSKAGLYVVNLTVKANYVTDFNGQEVNAYQEKNTTQTVRVVNSSSSSSIHIKQVRYKTSGHYYFNYWISFTDSSYSTSFYSINRTAYSPEVIQSYSNGSVFVNVSIQDSSYDPGTQDICFTVINNDSQTNTVNSTFVISLAQSNQISIYTIASFFGGYYNFLIFMATIGALIIGYAGLRESKEPPVIQVKESDGKTASYRVQGKKIHTTKKGGRSGKRI
jgi:hypothetical protein